MLSKVQYNPRPCFINFTCWVYLSGLYRVLNCSHYKNSICSLAVIYVSLFMSATRHNIGFQFRTILIKLVLSQKELWQTLKISVVLEGILADLTC